MTTETHFGRSSRVPEGCLKLVPRPWWSLGACRPVLKGRSLVGGVNPGSYVRKGVGGGSGCPGFMQDVPKMRPDASLVTLALRGIFEPPYRTPFGASVTH
ncbi:hypothetical protein CDL15_Pgr027246 [Punica granatum]|uniref:Uncharacterized protein n=1 Tax=Punica granatum TaxID=22663 RepID=A0A218XMK1_PUNGR|nr:hypothetical protein CDL15_Pgr027246 [Punica granatum]